METKIISEQVDKVSVIGSWNYVIITRIESTEIDSSVIKPDVSVNFLWYKVNKDTGEIDYTGCGCETLDYSLPNEEDPLFLFGREFNVIPQNYKFGEDVFRVKRIKASKQAREDIKTLDGEKVLTIKNKLKNIRR